MVHLEITGLGYDLTRKIMPKKFTFSIAWNRNKIDSNLSTSNLGFTAPSHRRASALESNSGRALRTRQVHAQARRRRDRRRFFFRPPGTRTDGRRRTDGGRVSMLVSFRPPAPSVRLRLSVHPSRPSFLSCSLALLALRVRSLAHGSAR